MRGLFRQLHLVAVAAILAAIYFGSGQFLRYEAVYVMAWSLTVLASSILLEYGLVNFGVAMYYAVGAYAVGLAYRFLGNADVAVGVPLALASGALLGLAIGLALGHLRGIYYALANLSLSMVIYGALVKFYDITGGSNGIVLPPPQLAGTTLHTPQLYLVAAALVLAALYFSSAFPETRMGRIAAGIRINELRAVALGASPRLNVALGTAVAATFAALGGALVAYATNIVTPDFAYWTTSGELVVASLIGALVSRKYGFLAGAAIYQIVRLYSYQFASPELVIGATLLAVLALWRRLFSRRLG
ncbi:branched-chain amino acid ABC transporter permease [Thermoproteus tenax]|uniref:ABC-type branched-chain amino acid transport system, permease component n=1 Tax=Thermoproteus tenax (strain ATCC 35583 / DSM 2078 / JCM 9277 / NBRC 100435 / Kra 1) TaxID=768679 RepID=G4RNB8_THETK|nr:branched-chain amino acid ABC transporter permease [Thermoproteus tenax]CCC81062.1 ABC-type branched-chain amino acid transport system, permease component [Thermoproteus tenax Kra 1]